MSQRPMKTVSGSRTTQIQVLQMADLNGNNRLFGGRLVSWMDLTAMVTARRHAGHNAATVRMEGIDFLASAMADDTVVLTGQVTYAGNTSMDIRVEAFRETFTGERALIARGDFVMIAIDEHYRPVPVPGLIPETEEERRLMAEREAIRQQRKGQN